MDPVTECEACLGTARGGRIRLTEHGAAILETLLTLRKQTLTDVRRVAIETGMAESVASYNHELREIKRMRQELTRTQIEQGWRDGQPERSDP